jgi:uncharacterized protein
MSASLKDRYGSTALVTGASYGIGEAISEMLAKEGIDLILVARSKKPLEELRIRLSQQYGVRVLSIAEDLTDTSGIERVFKSAMAFKGNVDILVNNAGSTTFGHFSDLPLTEELKLIDLNCRAPVALTHLFLDQMKKAGKGAVVILGSSLAHYPAPMFSTYAGTKAFDHAFGRALAIELKPFGIDVLTVLPWTTDSSFFKSAKIDIGRAKWIARKPKDVANTIRRSLGKRSVVADGVLNRLSFVLARFVPNSVMDWTANILLAALPDASRTLSSSQRGLRVLLWVDLLASCIASVGLTFFQEPFVTALSVPTPERLEFLAWFFGGAAAVIAMTLLKRPTPKLWILAHILADFAISITLAIAGLLGILSLSPYGAVLAIAGASLIAFFGYSKARVLRNL